MRAHFFLAALLGCSTTSAPTPPPPPPPPPPPGTLQIVMLGNSLTAAYEIPRMIADLAVAAGKPRPLMLEHAWGGWSLEEHWNSAGSLASVDAARTNIVILQQGPSTLASSGAQLLDYTGRFVNRLAGSNKRIGIYAVWPPLGGDIDAGIQHYTAAADAYGLALYPVAQAFRDLEATRPDIALRDGDQFHPGPAGAWLAAMIIAATIYDHDPTDFPNLRPQNIPTEWEAPLRAAAKAAIASYGRR